MSQPIFACMMLLGLLIVFVCSDKLWGPTRHAKTRIFLINVAGVLVGVGLLGFYLPILVRLWGS